MENFYDYIIECYSLSNETKRILGSLVVWAGEHYEDHGTLTSEGIHFLEEVLADNIGISRQEIIDFWKD